jgi:pimeloyl-ACP methyl ester carboxylesterase
VPAPDLDPAASTIFVDVAGARLRTATWGEGRASIVLLHDGLGSIGQWRDVPSEIHRATGATVMAYERAGHGASMPAPTGPWPADWLHREAAVLNDLLGALDIEAPALVGHSDGGSIALIHAATGAACQSIIALAGHVWVEGICVESIQAMRAGRAHFINALDRHHDAPAAVFEAWSGGWVSDDFASWDIRPLMGAIDCPVLVVQGTQDEYATDAQLTETVAAIGANAEMLRVDGGRTALHQAGPDLVPGLVAAFYYLQGANAPCDEGD